MSTIQKLLIANRGEIAVRILRTAKRLGILTVSIYSPSDALSPHVSLADQAIPLPKSQSESTAYTNGTTILSICLDNSVTLLHPGYGFLSENAEFAQSVIEAGITWLGPSPKVIKALGLKHEARVLAKAAGLPVVPGSNGLVSAIDIESISQTVGFPLMLKATAGGGGIGMVICETEQELKEKLPAAIRRAESLFSHEGVFVERYFPSARHIEVQVFGNGKGVVVHMGERECSIQRRHQKIIEETPSPFLLARPELRERMCEAAVRLCRSIDYSSAGTVEFIVDDETAEFYFLEVNTRIQVEHAITEAVYPGLDIVELMIKQGLEERAGNGGIDHLEQQPLQNSAHAIEVRLYSENPFKAFQPSPGLVQYVDYGAHDWLRVDGWMSTGTTITQFFDPLLSKLIVSGANRDEALFRMRQVLSQTQICGPSNNIEYLAAILDNESFREGKATTTFLDTFEFVPRAFTVNAAGLESTIQDFPGRMTGFGLPRSGPLDSLAFRAANLLCGNPSTMEGLEIIVVPGLDFELTFHVAAVVAITGKSVSVLVDAVPVDMWARVGIAAGATLMITSGEPSEGMRVYLAVRGGFPGIPEYLGSKSTSMGLGGYQGRSLIPGDQLSLGQCDPKPEDHDILAAVPSSLVPQYSHDWEVFVLAGPHADEDFITAEGISRFYNTRWNVSPSSNRLGIRLESSEKTLWSRINGGEGGSHPSNILDNGYALGSVNINGDTPVILSNEAPDCGGYVCLCTVAIGDMWKLGQLSPGNTVRFRPISWDDARALEIQTTQWLTAMHNMVNCGAPLLLSLQSIDLGPAEVFQTKLMVIENSGSKRPRVVFRQAGDSAILVEYGDMSLDFAIRARIHALETEIMQRNLGGIRAFCPCIRSTMCHYDPNLLSQTSVLELLVEVEKSLPDSVSDMEFPGRRITFPIVLDDSWGREAIDKYMKTTRNKAVYLPSNVVFGVGFYLGCPFVVPIDPRCRLVGQKMNPSRTFTPRGAIGIAGVVAAIYPIESPGGYQLYGRTLPAWQTWGKGVDFDGKRPWLLRPFDQIHFEVVSEEEYSQLELAFDAGSYSFKTEDVTFSMEEYTQFVESIEEEVAVFKARQAESVAIEELRNRGDEEGSTGVTVAAPLFATVWKIVCRPGDDIKTGDEVLVILEAMKTEIPVKAGRKHIGKTVSGVAKGIDEGGAVRPGDPLIVLT
ncbi:allophanate hydrolase subunit 2-domain-containing protein [Mycena floridula]|nr:allophanate hydrolase subunit 2-domain-containing protein [Mycena floridula]